jgi:uncharacterized membrane protein
MLAMGNLIFILHLVSTWFMTGLIWFVQIVHYPLYDRIGSEHFVEYERVHCSLTTLVVAPVMLTELFTGLALFADKPKFAGTIELVANMVLLGLIWLSTMFIADQLHGQLGVQFSPQVHRSLVLWNWLRTVAWTIRGLLLAYIVARGFK